MPLPDQKKLKRMYRTHVAIVVLFFISLSGIIGCAALFPTYIQVYNQARDARESSSAGGDTAGTKIGGIQHELEAHKQLVAALDTVTGAPMSVIVQNIAAIRGTVSINSILVDRVASSSAVIVVQGKAPTRESLVDFKKRLEDARPGTKVELPISDLTKSKDISYSLKITQ